ncbi:hypothetical protein V2J09_018348 [Rumex salicifolius]
MSGNGGHNKSYTAKEVDDHVGTPEWSRVFHGKLEAQIKSILLILDIYRRAYTLGKMGGGVAVVSKTRLDIKV